MRKRPSVGNKRESSAPEKDRNEIEVNRSFATLAKGATVPEKFENMPFRAVD